ncbi:hypothetical protein Tco_0077703 [Tanacetum coccineum]
MKGYVEQLERLGYVLPQDLSVGLILNGLTSDFASFVRNYNMHNMEKTICEQHALFIEYEKGLPKKAGHWKRNFPVYLAELIKKKKQVGTASSLDRRGEYISQEFKDYLKAYGIVQQLNTSIYTTTQWDVLKEESYLVRHCSINEESYNSADILLGISFELIHTYPIFSNLRKFDKQTP